MFPQTAPAVQPRARMSIRPPRPCPACGGALRCSHTESAGGGETVAVLVCTQCGSVERGRARAEDAWPPSRGGARDRQRPGRRPLDEGPVDNRVIDEEAARRLREQLGLE